LRTSNISLVGDRAFGEAGEDTVIINQTQNTGSTPILNGGADRDTLQVWGVTGATLSLGSLNATHFERLDLSSDGSATQVLLSSASIMSLVNNTSGVDTLTLRLGANDSFSIQTEGGVTFTQGQSIRFMDSTNTQIAQVNFEYV